MKIDQLLDREPFASIFEQTLVSFFDSSYGGSHRISWNSAKVVLKASRDTELWYCNPALNAVFVRNAVPAVRNLINEQYRNTPFRSRRHLQRFYVRLATLPWLATQFSSYVIEIEPAIPFSQWLVITGGNNRLRILDLKTFTATSILKRGFDSVFMRREVSVRRTPGSWPIPRLIRAANDGTWFEESFVGGTALNRLPPNIDRQEFERQAFDHLNRFISMSVRQVELDDYVARLKKDICAQVSRNALISPSERSAIESWVETVGSQAFRLGNSGRDSLALARGHGDFQPGNILVDDSSLWLIDWEYSTVRQVCYDALVYLLKSRFPSGLAQRLGAFVREDVRQRDMDLLKSAPQADTGKHDVRLVASVFLLEELLWYLEEIGNSLIYRPYGGWLTFRSEMAGCLNAIAS